MNADDLGARQWCEYAVPEFLPALRAGIAYNLATEHNLSQREIAERLGLTQAAVSHYITRRRGRRPRGRDHRLRKYGERLAARITTGLSGPRLTAAICGACTSYRKTEGVGPCSCILDGVSKPDFLLALGEPGGFPKQPCETFVVERLLPFFRSEIARRLVPERGQVRVAPLLGVSQPAVSQYMNGRRGEDSTLKSHPAVKEQLAGLERRLVEGVPDSDRKQALCDACVQIRSQLLESDSLLAA
ncbi:MAG: helix-turn-helix domain-containing protein [Thermoplasmata archaeon]